MPQALTDAVAGALVPQHGLSRPALDPDLFPVDGQRDPARPFGPAPHVPGEDGETIPLQVRRQLCRPLGITSMGVRDKYGADRVPWAHLAAPSRGRGLPLTVTLACLKWEMALLSDRLRSVPLQNSAHGP